MYNEIKEYISDLIDTYNLNTFDKDILEQENTVSNDITEYYISNQSVPCLIVPYNFTLQFKYSIENGKNRENDFRDAIENLIYSEELGYPTSSGTPTTIDSELVYPRILSVEHEWKINRFASRIKVVFVHIKYYNRTT